MDLPRQSLQGRLSAWAILGLVFALCAGVFLRLVWVEDIEYKGDEAWTFHRTLATDPNDPHPWLGMPTSYDLRHPSGTVYIFEALAWLFQTRTPLELARACQLTNCAAVLLVAIFGLFCVPRPEREYWLWGSVFAAVNPLAVVLQRKIWPPSIAPLFVMLFTMAFWYRSSRIGAFCWGLSGLLLAQIHPAGMFVSLGFALWVFLFQRNSARWLYWVIGSSIGLLLLVPWLRYAFETMAINPISQRKPGNAFEFKFWTRWISEAFGFSLSYSLDKDFPRFLAGPRVAGFPTYLIGALHVFLGLAMGYFVWKGGNKVYSLRKDLGSLLRDPASPTRFTILAGALGFGLIFTLSLLPVHRHYMLLTFPLMYVSLGYVGLRFGPGRWFLVLIALSQLLISLAFLLLIHETPDAIQGDYWKPYRMTVGK
ncbi:hypothetical protein KIH39_07105 [Telmatocola sphagniphila]|uniref:Uncharacterized protein n=1 Tax=Telmatocola sphagniphila TaxID=1123043 RepID=A0A8E6B9B4_9BACT|nr:hypothetical protein [Telmatocola sphagniphila]QVL33669.1 hypothetical protein KIH39_07105 [Telmatocola sphagniphila]